MINKVKFDRDIVETVKTLWPDWEELHLKVDRGETRIVLDVIEDQIGLDVDEDDIIRAFRNKKEYKLLEKAKRAKAIRDLYQKIFLFVDKHQHKQAERMNYNDCM
jgi:phosphatidylserine/phosphatidylglycerophosphate/cardiolipin synthase-like enzyme